MNPLISFFRRKILRIPADRWDHQYKRGQWDGLRKESVRFDAVVDLIRAHYQQPAILEIGCGEALMLKRMKEGDYSIFTGVDLSEVAITHAKTFESERVRFVCADMQYFKPERGYDVIAFNESLYYAKDPAEVFVHYARHLNAGGAIIITAFRNKYTAHLWPAIDARWEPRHKLESSVGELTWDIRMYYPAVQP